MQKKQNTLHHYLLYGTTWLALSTASYAYTCPQAQEYSDAFQQGGTTYNGITITATYEDIGNTGIQHDTNPPKRGEGVLLRVNSKPAYPNNTGTLAQPNVALQNYELYTFEYSSPVQIDGNVTIYDVDKSNSEHYYDAVALWYEDSAGTMHPMRAIAYGDGTSLVDFNATVTNNPATYTLSSPVSGYSVATSSHGGSSDIKGLVNYENLNSASIKKIYVAYWNNYDGTKNPKGFQGIRFCAPLPSNPVGPTNPAVTLYKYVVDIDDTNGNGITDAGDKITYGFKVVNSGDVDLHSVTVSDPLVTVNGAPISLLAVGDEDATNFTGSYIVTQADVMRGGVENTATVTAEDGNGNQVTDVSDTMTDPDRNPVTDPDTTETPNPFQVYNNDANDPTDDPTTVKTTPLPNNPKITLYKYVVKVDDTNGDGLTDAGDIITYGFKVVNSGQADLYDITISDSITSVTGGSIPMLPVGAKDDSTFTATYTITYSDVTRGGVENTASVTAKDAIMRTVNDTSDTMTTPEGNTIADPDTTETDNPLKVFNNTANPSDDPTTVLTDDPTGTIKGRVLALDGKEKHPIADVVLVLFDKNGNEVARTKTDKNGNYTFKAAPGKYYIQQQQPKHYVSAGENEGGQDNDATNTLFNTISVVLSAGENDIQNDFYEKPENTTEACACKPSVCNTAAPHGVTFNDDGSVTLRWLPTSNESGYELHMDDTFVTILDKDTTSYTLKYLESDKSFNVKVVALGEKGGTSIQTFTFKTPKVPVSSLLPALFNILFN
jgi:uncharacterized repeat protein (TIGR01451 family)